MSRFFLGVGAQKSGTSWVADYLSAHPEVGVSPIKEIHFFDSRFGAVNRGAIREPKRVRRHLSQLLGAERLPLSRRLALLGPYLGMLAYREDAYRRFLDRVGRGKAVAGEFTPAYSTLPDEAFERIERLLEKPRYVFVMRNPADRFVSQIRHLNRQRLEGDLVARLADPSYAARSDYAGLLDRLDRKASPERVHVMFYEHLFAPDRHDEECARLCAFLGVAARRGDRRRQVNAPRTPGARTAWDRDAVVRALRPQYEAMAARFGDALPSSWLGDLERLQAPATGAPEANASAR